MRSSRDVEDDRFYHEPSDADRARFFVDVPYFYEQAFDPTSGGQMKPGSFDERGYYQGGKYREDADKALNAYLDFINPIMPYKDTPEDMAFIQSFVDEKMKGMHPYNYYRGAMLDKLKDLPLSELGQMTRRGYTPHRELMRDMASITPNPRTYHGFDAEEMFLPNKNIPLKNIPDSIRSIIEGEGKIPEMMLRNADAKTKRSFRDRGKRLASLEAAIEANRRASSMDNANLNVRENAIQSFLPSIPANYGPRPYSKNVGGDVAPYARTSSYDYGAKPLHTFDEDDEASAVVMNEAFPEQWQLLNRSEDSFETAWDFLSTLNKEFVDDVDDDYVLPIKEREDMTDDDMNFILDLHDMEGMGAGLEDYLHLLANPKKGYLELFGDTSKIPYFTRSEDVIEDVFNLIKKAINGKSISYYYTMDKLAEVDKAMGWQPMYWHTVLKNDDELLRHLEEGSQKDVYGPKFKAMMGEALHFYLNNYDQGSMVYQEGLE